MNGLVPFRELTERQLDEIAAIYQEALAEPWEWPIERLRGAGRAPDSPLWAMAALEDGSPAGFIICQHLPRGQVWFVHYLAVRAELRSQGWGARLLSLALPEGEVAARQHGHAGSVGTLVQVENVDGPPRDANRAQRLRRQAFYQRNGAIQLGALSARWPWAPPEMPDYDMVLIPGSAWGGEVDDRLRYRLGLALMVEAYSVPPDAAWLVEQLARYKPSEP
jgi:ribosomal protein S18 acetylase RimI-like enzyme